MAQMSEEEFLRLWGETGGSATEVARIAGIAVRTVFQRRKRYEERTGNILGSTSPQATRPAVTPPGRLFTDIPDGTVLIGSDAHVWPGHRTVAQRGFIEMARRLKPAAVVLNGDLFDGASVSRHPTGIWAHEEMPTVKEELEACQDFMEEVRKASANAAHLWTWGNHDARFEARLSAAAREFRGVKGFALADHFPGWRMGMSLWVNSSVVIKHRWHCGIHAVHNNVTKGGLSIVTGHLHSLKVTPWTDYTGDRYGVDCGTLSDPDHESFRYTEDNPKNWRAGGAVLTLAGGRLLVPEVFQAWDEGHIQFRGELIAV